jgi:hypothetical protein
VELIIKGQPLPAREVKTNDKNGEDKKKNGKAKS